MQDEETLQNEKEVQKTAKNTIEEYTVWQDVCYRIKKKLSDKGRVDED